MQAPWVLVRSLLGALILSKLAGPRRMFGAAFFVMPTEVRSGSDLEDRACPPARPLRLPQRTNAEVGPNVCVGP